MNADDILAVLIAEAGDAIFATELAMMGGDRRCDFWTISPNGSHGFRATAYEIKVSRQDFRRDHAGKQREARLYSDRFFYVTPPGLVRPDEVPDWAGLIECHGGKTKTIVYAPLRDKDGPSWQFVVSLIRNSGKVNRDTDLLKQRLRYAEGQLRSAKIKLKEAGLQAWEFGIND